MPMQRQDEVTEVDLQELQRRFRVLEGDRKAYYETSQMTIKQNKEILGDLRSDNKELRKTLATLQRESGAGQRAGGGGADEDEIARASTQVNKLRSQYDQLHAQSKKRKEAVQALRDGLKDLEREAKRPNAEDSPLTRKIRMLENRLDKAMIKYNEAQSIRKTYEQIVKRLREERVGFDNQLAAIERTLEAKQHDYEELMLLSGDANHAREVALAELERVKAKFAEDQKERKRQLDERQKIVSMKGEMNARMEQREKMRQDIIAQAAGDLGEQDEQNLVTSVAVNVMQASQIREESQEHRKKIDVYENAFRRIREATGVSDVNEVIQKIISLEDTQNQLMETTKENQQKIEAIQEEKARLKTHVEEMKYSGPGGGHRRKMVDDHEENLSAAQVKLERCKLKYERLARMLIDVKAGIDHLADKLEPLGEDTKAIAVNDDTIVDVLYQCEQVLVNVIGKVRASDVDDGGIGDEPVVQDEQDGVSDTELMDARPHNRRITLPLVDEEDELDHSDDDGDMVDGDEEELTRDKVKKASSSIVVAQDRRKKGKKKRAGNGEGGGGRKTRVGARSSGRRARA